MKRSMLLPVVMIGLLLAFIVSVSANTAVKMECPTLKEQTSGRIQYMSGGVGMVERETLNHMAKDYNLGLVFARENGKYISNVQVTIEGVGHTDYLKTVSCGPWFFAKLPQGEYKVILDHIGMRHARQLHVGPNNVLHVLIAVWPTPVDL